eukprot:TRINITY_DN3942_c0_g1_i1.p1 TRINITY_DN3942_c0_g1~~TRINITY_DN3942_c0_g1_i1.p1  ORF type:complete len:142 (-),score=31.30 TRINITY_DN3942_c0_g1_i1:411-836(-)
MLRSLVGSEMCIRDRYNSVFLPKLGATIKSLAVPSVDALGSPAPGVNQSIYSSPPSKPLQAVPSVALYQMGESSTAALENMNQVLHQNRKRRKMNPNPSPHLHSSPSPHPHPHSSPHPHPEAEEPLNSRCGGVDFLINGRT